MLSVARIAIRTMSSSVHAAAWGAYAVPSCRYARSAGYVMCCLLMYCVSLMSGCNRSAADASAGSTTIAVTTSYLESAVTDIAGDHVQVVRLLPPGSCPGHFDITPGMVDRLRQAIALLRFDFQSGIDDRVRAANSRLHIIAIPAGEGLAMPSTYLQTCNDVARAMVDQGIVEQAVAGQRLDRLGRRLDELSARCHDAVEQAGLRDSPVMSSVHQRLFAEWLGFVVPACLSESDASRARAMIDIRKQGRDSDITLVLGNVHEGPQQSQAFGYHLGVPVVMLRNFPAMNDDEGDFIAMVDNNVHRIVEAVAP